MGFELAHYDWHGGWNNKKNNKRNYILRNILYIYNIIYEYNN